MSEATLPILVKPRSTKQSIFGRKRQPQTEPKFERYQYSPLGDRQIRLLRISVDPNGHLICNFQVQDLASSLGTYRAISYCWGNPTPAYRVLCNNDQSLVITNSCAEILTHIVPRHPETFFWIDQLCINQKDNAERSAQVLLMGEIYSSTEQVIAWLGRGTADTEKALDFVDKMYKEVEDQSRKGLRPTLEPLISSEPSLRNLPAEMARERRWDGLSRFLRNPWFERVWVMQEVIMARAKSSNMAAGDCHTVLSIENRNIDFDVLAKVMSILEQDHIVLNLIFDRQNEDGTTENGVFPPGMEAVRLFSTFRNSRSQSKPVLVNGALRETWHFKATDPRDKLYAVLGFCDDATDARFRPDYDSSIEDVYKMWTAVLLERGDECALPLPMAGLGIARTYTGLPSWVPDFATSSYEVNLRSEAIGQLPSRAYQASGAKAWTDIVVDSLTARIRLNAIQIDIVEAVFPQSRMQKPGRWGTMMRPLLLTPDKAEYRGIVHWLEDIEAFIAETSDESETSTERRHQILSQTMAGNYPTDHSSSDDTLSQAFTCWYQSHRELAGKDRAGFVAAQSRKADFYDQVQAYEDLKASSLQSRPMFGTTKKRLLGHGPNGIMVGDVVCVIKGGVTPFLLRKEGTRETGTVDRWRL
ncbi:MAG: hypothetical protein Q9170_001284, partial [Blastenia crenularia]